MMTFYDEYKKKESKIYKVLHEFAGFPKRFGFMNEYSREFQLQIYNLIGAFAGTEEYYFSSKLVFHITIRNFLGQIMIHTNQHGHVVRSRFSEDNWRSVCNEDIDAFVKSLDHNATSLQLIGEDTTLLMQAIDEMAERIVEDYRLVAVQGDRSIIWV
jgi:hypothetical protein